MILTLWIDPFQYVSYGMVPLCWIRSWKEHGLYGTTWCYLRSDHFVGQICDIWTLIKHNLNWVSYSMLVCLRGCPWNAVFSCLSPKNDRLLRIKDNTNIHNKCCFLNYMTMKLNYESILPLVYTNLMLSYVGFEIAYWVGCCRLFSHQ
jgi:hypothetical protein